MRTIDADVLAEIFIDRMEKVKERFGFNSSEAGILSGAYKLLQSQPTIEPRTGKWIPHHDEVIIFDGMTKGGMACSVCGWKTHNKMHLFFGCPYKYCPNCGSLNEESEHYTMEEFMYGQDLGNPEDGSL